MNKETYKKILINLLSILAIVSGMSSWQFNIPFTLTIFDVLAIVIILAFIFGVLIGQIKPIIIKIIKPYLIFIWLIIFIKIFSGIKILLKYNYADSFEQYFFAILSEITYTIFFSICIVLLSQITIKERAKIVKCFIFGVFLSSVYGITHMIFFLKSGVYIDDIIWQYVSINKSTEPTNIDWAVLGMPRGIGFPGVNAAATYNVLAIPLLLAYYFKERSNYLLIILIVIIAGMLVTFSRTGLISFLVSTLIYFYLERKKRKYLLRIPIGFGLLITGLFIYYQEYINLIVASRSGIDWSRIGLFKGAFKLISENLILGVGVNNYSIVNKTIADIHIIDHNLHNSWLSIFVETGLIGLLIFIFFMFYMIRVSIKKYTFFSNALISTLIGVFIGGLTNSLFDIFYFNFWLVLIFANIILDNEYYYNQRNIRFRF